jgi:hypothetical protein
MVPPRLRERPFFSSSSPRRRGPRANERCARISGSLDSRLHGNDEGWECALSVHLSYPVSHAASSGGEPGPRPRRVTTRPARRQGTRAGRAAVGRLAWIARTPGERPDLRCAAALRLGPSGRACPDKDRACRGCPRSATGRQAGKGSHEGKPACRAAASCRADGRPRMSPPGGAVAISCRGGRGERKARRIRSAASGARVHRRCGGMTARALCVPRRPRCL